MDFSVTLLLLATFHWVFDFVLQSNWMATNKSKNNAALSAHVGVYTIGMIVAGLVVFGFSPAAMAFGLLNGMIHFGVDFCTSRMTSHLWNKKDVHNFFVVIGFDQLLHLTTIVLTLKHFGA